MLEKKLTFYIYRRSLILTFIGDSSSFYLYREFSFFSYDIFYKNLMKSSVV